MNKALKKNLVMFIVFAMCISLFFSMKPLAVNANSKANVAVSGSDRGKWVEINNGLYGGTIEPLAIDPTNTQTIYAGTDGGVFKSTDGGANWSEMNNGLTNTYVWSLAIDPTNTQTIYAGTDGGVFKSTDGGANWSEMNTGLTNTDVSSLVIDPKNTQTIYAETFGGVFKSTDGGASWTQTGLTDAWVRSLAIDPTNTQTIYAGTDHDGVFKSTDGGASWSEMNNGLINGLFPHPVYSLAIDPTNTQTIYAGTYDGSIFKSTNGGASWSKAGLTNTYVSSLTIDPTNTQTIYAGTRGGVFKSTDGGANWTKTGLTDAWINSLAIDPTNTQTIYAGTDGGVFKSTNGGANWTKMNNGLTNIDVDSLAVDPTNTQTIYAGTDHDGVFKSTDGGASWSEMNNGLTNTYVWSLAIDPTNTQIIYAGTYGDVFKSTDGGASWSEMNNGLINGLFPRSVYSLAIDPTNTQIIYAGTKGNSVFKSTDGGASWTKMNTGLTDDTVYSLAIDPTNTQIIYAGTNWGGGVFKSTNGGASWSKAGLTNTYVWSLAIDPTNTQIIYAGTKGNGVFKSTDGGANWTKTGLTDAWINSLAIDPTNTQIIYAGTYDGVFKSTDGGASWSEMNNGLTNTDVWSLAVDLKNTQTIYAGTPGGGSMFKYTCFPSSPQNLQANASASSIVLSWNASTQGTYPIAGYAIYRGTTAGGESSTPIATVGASITTYTDNNVTQGTTYYYYVKAYDNQDPPNYSDPSNEVSAIVPDANKIAFIYSNETKVISFKSLLTSNGYIVDLIPKEDISSHNFAIYDIIIIGPDTGEDYDWGDDASVSRIYNSNKPILGLGFGGASFFQDINLSINWGNGWINSNNNSTDVNCIKVYVVDPLNRVFQQPYNISIPDDKIIQIYQNSGRIGEYAPVLPNNVVYYGREPTNDTHYTLVSEGKYFLWGFTNSPDHMTQVGKDLFTNVVSYLITLSSFTLHIPSGWSIISVPFDTDPALLISNANIQYLFYWDGSFWQVPITLQPGIGYLVYNTSPSEIDINLTGTPTSSPFTENATGNWQVIGNPFTSPATLTSTSTIQYLFYWNGSFWQVADPNNLQPGVGYLILTNSTGTLTFTKNP